MNYNTYMPTHINFYLPCTAHIIKIATFFRYVGFLGLNFTERKCQFEEVVLGS